MRTATPGSSNGSNRADDQALCTRVSAEFREMPGLTITVAQAARLFNVDRPRCARVLGSLVDRGVLVTDGQLFTRVGTGRHSA
jgi:hypothetical protein